MPCFKSIELSKKSSCGSKSCCKRHPDEPGKTFRLHFCHDVRPMNFGGPGANVEVIRDRLVRQPGNDGRKHLKSRSLNVESRSRTSSTGSVATFLSWSWSAARRIASMMTVSSNGFSIKSIAPAFMASTAIGNIILTRGGRTAEFYPTIPTNVRSRRRVPAHAALALPSTSQIAVELTPPLSSGAP